MKFTKPSLSIEKGTSGFLPKKALQGHLLFQLGWVGLGGIVILLACCLLTIFAVMSL